MMAVNLDGFLTVKHAARAMVGAGNGGSIITMASVTGMAGTPLAGHYAAAKAGVINLTKTAALELRPASRRHRPPHRVPGVGTIALLHRSCVCSRWWSHGIDDVTTAGTLPRGWAISMP